MVLRALTESSRIIQGILIGGGVFIFITVILAIHSSVCFIRRRRNESAYLHTSTSMQQLMDQKKDDFLEEFNFKMDEIRSWPRPIKSRRDYTIRSLALQNNHIAVGDFKPITLLDNYTNSMLKFEKLLYERDFTKVFLKVMEKHGEKRDKLESTAFTALVLLDTMEYTTDVFRTLLISKIKKAVRSGKPSRLFNKDEGVFEKFTMILIAVCMYDYLKEKVVEPLYELYYAVRTQVEQGVIDELTQDAEFSLATTRLFREDLKYKKMTIQVLDHQTDTVLPVPVFDCDTIEQVKIKIINERFKNQPFSQYPSHWDYDLIWIMKNGNLKHLQNVDETTQLVSHWKKFNTLCHYGVREDDNLFKMLLEEETDTLLATSKSSSSGISISPSTSAASQDSQTSNNTKTSSSRSGLSSRRPLVSNSLYNLYMNHTFHIMRPADSWVFVTTLEPSNSQMNVKDIPQTKILDMLLIKKSIQTYFDKLVNVFLNTVDEPPMVFLWLHNIFRIEMKKHNILNPKVAHKWHTQTILKFWGYLISNPDLILDVEVTPALKTCLVILEQELLDAARKNPYKNSFTTYRLLTHEYNPIYKQKILDFYEYLKSQAVGRPVGKDFLENVAKISKEYNEMYDSLSGLKELYYFVTKYRKLLMEKFSKDPAKKKYRYKLLSIALPTGVREFDETMTEKDILKTLLKLTNKSVAKSKRGRAHIVSNDGWDDYEEDPYLDEVFKDIRPEDVPQEFLEDSDYDDEFVNM